MGKIVHIEIPAPDLEKAGEFYTKVFGWKVQMMPEMNYALWSPPDEGVGGGFSKEYAVNTEGILIHIGVDDIEAKLAEIEAAGGKTITPKTKISDEFGYFAEFSDISGNKIGLWSEK